MENNNGANPPNNDEIPQTFACNQCGKEFQTARALLGHSIHHSRRPRADHVAPPRPLEEEAGAGRRRWVLALECPGPNPNPNPILSWSTKGKRGRGPTKPPVDEAHAVWDAANVNEIFDRLTEMIRFVSSRGEDDPAAASSSSKRLRPDFHLARGLTYDEATDTVSFSRRALLSRCEQQDEHPSNAAVVDREADDDDRKEVEEAAAAEEEEKDGRDSDGAGPSSQGPRYKLCDLNEPYVPENVD